MKRAGSGWARVLAVWLVAAGLYIWLGGESLRLLWLASTTLIASGAAIRWLGPSRIDVRHTCSPPRLYAGDETEVSVRIDIRSVLPVPWLLVENSIADCSHRKLLFPGFRRSLTYSYRLEGLPRGVWASVHSDIAWGDLFGWFRFNRRLSGEMQGITVLPRPDVWPEERRDFFGGTGDREEETPIPRDRNDVRRDGLRDYIPGDPMNRIHWRNSAKLGRLQSFLPRAGNGIRTCVALVAPPQSAGTEERIRELEFERTVSAAAGLLCNLLRHRTPYKLWQSSSSADSLARIAEYAGDEAVSREETLLPLASIRMSGISGAAPPLPEHSSSAKDGMPDLQPEKDTPWIIVAASFHEQVVALGIRLLQCGIRDVTICCAPVHGPMPSERTPSETASLANAMNEPWAREYFSRGGRLQDPGAAPIRKDRLAKGGEGHATERSAR